MKSRPGNWRCTDAPYPSGNGTGGTDGSLESDLHAQQAGHTGAQQEYREMVDLVCSFNRKDKARLVDLEDYHTEQKDEPLSTWF